MRNILVQCKVYVQVEYPDDATNEFIKFDVEENHCPGTGRVGAALDELIEQSDKHHICWACPNGTNEIIGFDYKGD